MADNILTSATNESRREEGYSISLPWWDFLRIRQQFLDLISGYNLNNQVHFCITEEAMYLLTEATKRTEAYNTALESDSLPETELMQRLQASGLSRDLKWYQTRNICQIANMPAAATFSVPGAGKTTEALAVFLYRASPDDRLLVVAPKNAFAAWDEQLSQCISSRSDAFIRLRTADNISLQLYDDPKFMLISYQQLAISKEVIADHLSKYPVHVFLDESHRVKGQGNVTTEAALSISHLPASKLIMSGTPMPQSTSDLISQFNFLFPEIDVDEDSITAKVTPIYVRTTKEELDLPPVKRIFSPLPMDPIQDRLYSLMKSEIARSAENGLGRLAEKELRNLGRSVVRLLQFVSNPALLAGEMDFAYKTELDDALAEGSGPKIRYVINRVRSLAREGKKVIVWSSFVRNVEELANTLEDLGAVYIHGGVDAGNDEDETTREGKIRLFHDDPTVFVMVANPAAAAEGISLHSVCHHAIYLDRSFNAAQYLQSEDRIHRIGLRSDQETTIEIVECEGSIDEVVRSRLEYKVSQMAIALNDASLQIASERIDIDEEFDEAIIGGIDQNDFEALFTQLRNDQ